jgi:hypothetical protein
MDEALVAPVESTVERVYDDDQGDGEGGRDAPCDDPVREAMPAGIAGA